VVFTPFAHAQAPVSVRSLTILLPYTAPYRTKLQGILYALKGLESPRAMCIVPYDLGSLTWHRAFV
jgi:hypothetical protein